jgi:hypothetical protein
MLKTGPVCHTWPIFALFWQLTFRGRSFAQNVEVLLVFFRKLHSYINQNLSYYCHFLHWQRSFKILLCVVSVNESFIDLRHRFIVFKVEWIDIANTEYRYTAIRIPVNTGIFNMFFLSQTELLTVEKNQVLIKY